MSLTRAKVWDECYYDQFLITKAIMISTQGGYSILVWNGIIGSYFKLMARGINSIIIIHRIINIILLQAILPSIVILYSQFLPYQQRPIATIDLPMVSASKDTNKNLLLNLTKKIEDLAVYMIKDKEKQ